MFGLLIIVLFFVSLWSFVKSTLDDSICITFASIVIWVFSFVLTACLIIAYFESFGTVAKYQAFNATLSQIEKADMSEDIIGKVAEWNERIASYRKYDSMFWGDPYVPDRLLLLEPIKVPRLK